MDNSAKLNQLRELVSKFHNNISQYTDKNYKEQRLRMDFVDAFFELFDWDIRNRECAIEEFRDVVIEDNLEISGTQKYPDYTFRIGNEPIFFVETKKPSINLKSSIDSAYQVRRYGYSAKRKISILTDFEEFAIYDTRVKPGKNDPAYVARLFYCTFDEYEKNWEFLFGLLAKNAVKQGSINKYVGKGTRRGTLEVDKDFLRLIEDWRGTLAKNIAKNNQRADLDGINLAIQKIIDRIIFLRICEEKGIEQFENLRTIGNDKAVYEKLVRYFDKANNKYNSELFKPDDFVNDLEIDDEILRDIITAIYQPECPYAFSVLPVEILGNIYEQFLGKTIRLTESHQAKIEEKPEVRKAGGVYYTPKYIVDYIVKNTVGEKIKELTPKEIEKIKILDPACGSGSFLLGAYTYLLNYHLVYYTKKENLAKAIKNEVIYSAKKDSYKLTIKEKQKILLNNLFGVDIDAQAVEVTKLSLMLKLLEGESDESAGMLFKYSETKLLPTLSNNIKCGNSLISSDFYKDKNLSLFGNEEMKKINAFDWEDMEKGFGEIMAKGGFDCVIGNPPWGGDIDVYLEYIASKYPNSSQGFKDTYKLFLELAISLSAKKSFVGMITPNTYFFAPLFKDLRLLLNSYHVKTLINLGERVFENVTAPSAIVVLFKTTIKNPHLWAIDLSYSKENLFKSQYLSSDKHILINQSSFSETDDNIFTFYHRTQKDNEVTFAEFADVKDAGIQYHRFGIGMQNRGGNDLFERLFSSSKTAFKNSVSTWYGSLINRYYMESKSDEFFNLNYKERLNENEAVSFSKEYQGLKPKIIWRQTSSDIKATLDTKGVWFRNTIQCCVIKERYATHSYNYLLGILNSKYINFLYDNLVKETGRVFPQVKTTKLKCLPIRIIDFSSSSDKGFYEKMINLVDQMLETQGEAHSAKSESDQKHYQQKIEILDKQIDELVYELYGLTKEEIAVVEGRQRDEA